MCAVHCTLSLRRSLSLLIPPSLSLPRSSHARRPALSLSLSLSRSLALSLSLSLAHARTHTRQGEGHFEVTVAARRRRARADQPPRARGGAARSPRPRARNVLHSQLRGRERGAAQRPHAQRGRPPRGDGRIRRSSQHPSRGDERIRRGSQSRRYHHRPYPPYETPPVAWTPSSLHCRTVSSTNRVNSSSRRYSFRAGGSTPTLPRVARGSL